MTRAQSPTEPFTRITKERIEAAVTILKQEAQSPARERLVELYQELDRLLGEIEMFKKIVYCHDRYRKNNAAACSLDHGVLRVLAGSTMMGQKLPKDQFWHAHSPAATAVRGYAGQKMWQDR